MEPFVTATAFIPIIFKLCGEVTIRRWLALMSVCSRSNYASEQAGSLELRFSDTLSTKLRNHIQHTCTVIIASLVVFQFPPHLQSLWKRAIQGLRGGECFIAALKKILFFLMAEGYYKIAYVFLSLKMDRSTKRSNIVNKHHEGLKK